MAAPIPDRNIIKLYELTYSGKELEAALQAFSEYPTYTHERNCNEVKMRKERLRLQRMKQLLKQVDSK